MIMQTRVFELANGRYQSLSDLAKAMNLSVSQVYWVREVKRGINEKFIVGAKKAFPERRLDELFYFNQSQASRNIIGISVAARRNHIIQQLTAMDFLNLIKQTSNKDQPQISASSASILRNSSMLSRQSK